MVFAIAIPAAVVAYIGYLAWKIIYNLFFSPLKDVPGDKLAAITSLYEFYWDCVQPGLWWKQTERMHAQYGPIIRIGPNEVHISDPEYFDVLYNNSLRLEKDPWFYRMLGLNHTAFTSVSDAMHRQRRGKVNSFFSKANVDRMESLRQRVLRNMFAIFEKKMVAGEPIELRLAARSFASDVVCDFCFIESPDYAKKDDFSALFHKGQEGYGVMLPWFRHVPGLAQLMMSMPDSMIPYMPPDTQAAMAFLKYIEREVTEIAAGKDLGPDGKPMKRTIIREIIDSDLPADYKTSWTLLQEGQSYSAAGTTTTGRVLEESVYHVLATPEVAAKLIEEVRNVEPGEAGELGGRVLEQLPYLNAVVLEAFRLAPPLVCRLPRINRNGAMKYGDVTLPPNTILSMSPYEILQDPNIFEDPKRMKPERWLDPVKKNALLKYMVHFGKGTRNCVGQNLAVAEVFLVIGNLFRRYDMKLYQTGVEEVTTVRDNFMPAPRPGGKGVRVLLSTPQRV